MLIGGLLTMAISGCISSEPIEVFESPTAFNEIGITTATRVWFPSTSTPTVYVPPENTPTPYESPDYGPLVITDDFSDRQGWLSGSYAAGNVAYGKETLNLAVSVPGGSLTSFRKDSYFTDFYWEMTVTGNLCSPTDAFGLIFWSVNDKNYHRLSFNCGGEYAVEKVKNGKASPLLDWSPSSQVPRGGISPFRVGLWVGGGYVRIYLNDIYQDEVYLSPATGGIGIFAQSGGGPAVNISYADMQLFSVSTFDYPATPTPTPTPTKKPFPTLPTP